MIRLLNLLILFCSFIPFLASAQSYNDIDKMSNYIGYHFDEFELGLKIKNSGVKKRLGLEHRSYDFKNYFILVSENDDSQTIGEMYFNIDSAKDNIEKWYSIVSKLDKDEQYTFVRSFIADPRDKITSNKLNYSQIVNLLRNSLDTKDWVFDIIYQKNSTYLRIGCSSVSVSVDIQNKPFPLKSYELDYK